MTLKKIFSLLFVVSMVFTFVACGDDDDDTGTTGTTGGGGTGPLLGYALLKADVTGDNSYGVTDGMSLPYVGVKVDGTNLIVRFVPGFANGVTPGNGSDGWAQFEAQGGAAWINGEDATTIATTCKEVWFLGFPGDAATNAKTGTVINMWGVRAAKATGTAGVWDLTIPLANYTNAYPTKNWGSSETFNTKIVMRNVETAFAGSGEFYAGPGGMHNAFIYLTNITGWSLTVAKAPFATPTFTPAGSTYTSNINVAIACSTAVGTKVIKYTIATNAIPADPSASVGTTYTTPITIPKNLANTVTIKAIVLADGDRPASSIATAEYKFSNYSGIVTCDGIMNEAGWATATSFLDTADGWVDTQGNIGDITNIKVFTDATYIYVGVRYDNDTLGAGDNRAVYMAIDVDNADEGAGGWNDTTFGFDTFGGSVTSAGNKEPEYLVMLRAKSAPAAIRVGTDGGVLGVLDSGPTAGAAGNPAIAEYAIARTLLPATGAVKVIFFTAGCDDSWKDSALWDVIPTTGNNEGTDWGAPTAYTYDTWGNLTL